MSPAALTTMAYPSSSWSKTAGDQCTQLPDPMQVSRSMVIFNATPTKLRRMATDEPRIRLTVDGGVGRLELNRPEAANSIDLQLAIEFEEAALRLAADASLRVVLLTGAGARFCGGGDVGAFAASPLDMPELLADIISHLHPALMLLAESDAPVVAAVQGSAAGAGLGLVLGADLVLAARSAKFVMAFTAIGLSPDSSSTWFLPRVVGHRRAMELALTNRVLSADEAQAWGMVTTVVDDDALGPAADEMVARLATGPTAAYGRTARLLRRSWDASLADQLDEERRQLVASGGTADGREGVTAFAAKRPPKFTGS